MARLQLNKSSLARETANLRSYERFLPSLDLKRQQLMAERRKASATVTELENAINLFRVAVGEKLPMLANSDVDLTGLVTLTDYDLGTENIVGTHLPLLEHITVDVQPYALLGKPHWVDKAVELLRDMMEMHLRAQVARRRVMLLDKAVATITQRVNLFDKVLIPQAKANIKKIRIYLSDAEMSAIVRSKLAKRKHAAANIP